MARSRCPFNVIMRFCGLLGLLGIGLSHVCIIPATSCLAMKLSSAQSFHLAPVQGGAFHRIRSLFRGLGPTLAKDVPFAGIYWALLEPTRTTLVPAAFAAASSLTSRQQPAVNTDAPAPAAAFAPSPAVGPLVNRSSPDSQHDSRQSQDASAAGKSGPAALFSAHCDTAGTQPQSRSSIVAVNAVSGALAAGIGGWLTTPLDVVKTHAQTASTGAKPQTTMGTLVKVWQRGGSRALFTGAGPRLVRTSIAYAILMSSYELCKAVYAGHD